MERFIYSAQRKIRFWYVPLIIGLLLIFLGIYTFNVPLQAFAILVMIFSISFAISGALELWFTLQNKENIPNWGLHLLVSLMVLGLGVYLILNPLSSAFILAMFVAFNLLLKSVQGLFFSFSLKNTPVQNWYVLTILSGIGIVISLLLVSQPMIAGLSLVILTAMSFIFAGMIAVMFSLFLRRTKHMLKQVKNNREGLSEYEVIE
jgi:uncharacterized membrane protein HdeD (DUF308 family)